MAKKKYRKKKKHIKSIPTTLFAILSCCIALGISMLYEYYDTLPESKKKELIGQTIRLTETVKERLESETEIGFDQALPKHTPNNARLTLSAGAELPLTPSHLTEEVVVHKGYTASYNQDYLIPNWVAYELTVKEIKGKATRNNQFVEDPDLKGKSATDKDYYSSGYDRGHMAPAGDMKWDTQAMDESFYFSNICPQAPNLNRGVWRILEEALRERVRQDSAILIVCGPIVDDRQKKRIGKNKVRVPQSFFKVIVTPYSDPIKGIGFIFPNDDCPEKLSTYAVPIDEVERITGIDFFHKLPKAIEEKVESECQFDEWAF